MPVKLDQRVTQRDSIPWAEPAAPATPAIGRRSFVQRVGIGAVTIFVVADTVVAYRAYDQGVAIEGHGPAFKALAKWQSYTEPEAAVAAAVLTASAHNTQPWLFAVFNDRIDVYADRRRTTGANDALQRELDISLGCALENMVVAAEASGYATEVVLDPGGEPNLVATVGLRSAPARGSELYRAIGMRRSDRSKFTVAHVPAQALGLVSLGLAAVIGVAALAWPRATTTGRGLAVMAAMALPAAVGLTTTGAVWIPAALVGAFAAVLLLAIGLPLVFGGNRAHRVMTR